ncbi:MAG: GNAT family N-acetyltransferase [Clostridia bacterium]
MRNITKKEIKKVCKLFAEAFSNDPLYIYFFPNPKSRERKAYYFFRFEVCQSLDKILVNDDFSAATLFLKPYQEKNVINVVKNDPFLYLKMLFTVGIPPLLRALKYIDISHKIADENMHKGDAYFCLLSIDKAHRGKGMARQIFDELCGDYDVFLETQNKANTELYKHLGFELVDECAFPFAPQVKHYSMRREATKNKN